MTSSLQAKSSIGYGVAMLLAVTFFLFAEPSLRDSQVPWIAGTGSTLAAFGFGRGFGRWYVPVGGDRPTFELVACPLIVLVLSIATGLLLLWAWLLAFGPSEPQPFTVLLVVLGFGFPAFVASAWPALTLLFGTVGAWLAWSSRAAPNNSFKPSPLRGLGAGAQD